MKQLSMKDKRNDERYIKTFMTKGNAKLMDYRDDSVSYKYAMFNLRAVRTCPFRSADCERFCYAKRDERYPQARANRDGNMNASKRSDFIQRMIYTIETELSSKRYQGSVMILRIHESGDFYRQQYLNDWIDIMAHFSTAPIIFQFYTKSFKYFLELDHGRTALLNTLMNKGNVSGSLSSDISTTKEQRERIAQLQKRFPMFNQYIALKDISTIHYSEKCDCANCAKCGTCIHASGKVVAVEIH